MTNVLQCRLDHHIRTFEATLREKNYQPDTIRTYRVVLRRLASMMDSAGIAAEELTMDLAARLVRDADHDQRRPNKRQNVARRFVEHLIECGVVAAEVPTAQQVARSRLRA